MKTKVILFLLSLLVVGGATVVRKTTSGRFDNLIPATNAMGWPNAYRPTSPYSPTVGAGTDLTEVIESLNLPPEVAASLKKDINGEPRVRGRWDVGAYQYPPVPYPLTNVVIKAH